MWDIARVFLEALSQRVVFLGAGGWRPGDVIHLDPKRSARKNEKRFWYVSLKSD
jgi:hypothetical protein